MRWVFLAYLAFVAIWAPTEPALAGLGVELNAWGLAGMCLLALAIAGWRVRRHRRVKIEVPDSTATITVCGGDLLAFPNHILVPVSEYFDSEIGSRVSRESIHGKCISQLFNGDEEVFRTKVDTALANEKGTKEKNRGTRYPVGTVARVEHRDRILFLVALTRIDKKTDKAKASLDELYTAWSSAWRAIREHGNRRPVAVPVMGTGLSNVGLGLEDGIRLALLVLNGVSHGGRVADEVTIMVRQDLTRRVDLAGLAGSYEK